MPKTVVIAGVASGLACLMPLNALAQAAAAASRPASAATPATPADAADITRVVITAQKRNEDIRDVPLSVSVLSGDQLRQTQISTVEDLTRNIPNVSFTTQAGPGLGTVEIRGVSSQAGSATVSVYLDDVSLTTRNLYSTGSAEPRFFDLASVEVLRGPQGTLYGASSLGGTIKFVSKQPDAKAFSGSASLSVSGTQSGGTNYEAEGVLNIPLIKDSSALRIGVQRGHDSGYIDQVDPATLKVLQKDINSVDWTVAKLALRADLGNGWSITPSLFAQQTNSDDIDAAYLAVGGYQPPPAQAGAPLGRFQTSKIVREPGRDRLSVPSVTLDGETSAGHFTGVLSGYQRRFNRIQDGTSINSVFIGQEIDPVPNGLDPIGNPNPALAALVGGLPSAVQLYNKVDQTSVELRFTSKDYDPASGNAFTWIGGAYGSDAVTQVVDNEPVFGINQAFLNAGEDINDPANLGGTFPGAFLGDSSYYSARHYHDKQASVFGELTWHLTPKLAATVGLRYLVASQHFTREGDFYYAGGPSTAVINSTGSATTPSFKINWAVDPQTSLYTNISKGFRLGGANRPVPDTPLVESDIALLGLQGKPPASFGSDSLWSYEVGSKSTLWDQRVSLNLAAFYLNWKNIQQDVTLPNAGFDFETNVGRARSYGLEAELRARVTDNLTLSASAGYTDATLRSGVAALGDTVRVGDAVQGVPKGSASLGADYHWAVTDTIGAFVRGNGQWTGKSHGSLFRDDADYKRPSYFTADASAGVNIDRWEFTAFVKNATNTRVAIQHPSIQGENEAYYLRPRTVGVMGTIDF